MYFGVKLTHVRGERGTLRGSLDGVHVVEFDEAVPGARGNQGACLGQGTHGSIVAHQSTLVHEPVASSRQEDKQREREWRLHVHLVLEDRGRV